MRKIDVVSYNSRWSYMFEEEANQLRKILGSKLVAIYHIGSTSVTGLASKPVIDMLPVVIDINQIDGFNSHMVTLGYVAKGENGVVGRRYFQKGGDSRTHHIHIYQDGNHNIERHLAFRDYLRTHPEEARKYGELKVTLAGKYPYNIESYIKGKESLVLEIEQRAMRWFRDGNLDLC